MSLSNCGHDERWQYRGGAAGDQNGTEWQIVKWYSYPWNVMLRYPNAKVRHWMGDQARAAARNNHIGYDQGQRQTFWMNLADSNYDAAQITVNCETDCSAGVLAIAKAAGYHFGIDKLKNINQNGYTGNEEAILTAAGFEAHRESKYLTSDSYLDNGDVLLNTRNHTAFNIDAGSKCDASQDGEDKSQKLIAIQKAVSSEKILIDVSEHNGKIDWNKAKTDIYGAILRCGFGSDEPGQDDDYWKYNVSECERLGIPYGVYLYSYAVSESQARSEAAHTIRLINGHKPFMVYFDSEQKGTGSVAKRNAEIFVKAVRAAGYKCGVYASESWYNSYMKGVDCDSLWIAKYGTNNGTKQTKPNVGTTYDIWQYTSVGRISGSNHNTDMNIMYNDITGKTGSMNTSSGSSTPQTQASTTKPIPTITYAVKTASTKLADVKNGAVAGNGQKVIGVKIGVNYGTVSYRVHCGGRWLPRVSGNNWNDFENGYAGDDRNAIDAIQIYYTSDRKKTEVYEAVYCVKPIGGSYLPEVYDTNWESGDGDYTAGIFNRPFGELKIKLSKV